MTQLFTPSKKPIEEATDDELRSFLANVLQVEGIDKLKTREKLLAAITNAGWPNPFITVLLQAEREVTYDDDAVKVRPVAHELKGNQHYNDDPVVEMEISETPLPGGSEPAYVSVNGRNIVIPRNKVFKVPYRFYLALKDAHEIHIRQNPETLELVESRVTNYPITVHNRPSPADIAAWEERVGAKVLGA